MGQGHAGAQDEGNEAGPIHIDQVDGYETQCPGGIPPLLAVIADNGKGAAGFECLGRRQARAAEAENRDLLAGEISNGNHVSTSI